MSFGSLSSLGRPSCVVQTGARAHKPVCCGVAPQTAAALAQRNVELENALLTAQDKAVELFKVLDSKDLLQPGRSEEEINKDIYDLAASQFGTKKFWHPNLVRTGANSILPIHQRATPLSLAADDILYIDLGPIFDQKVEADFARTYVIGDDLEKLKLAAVLPKIFATCKRKYLYNPDQTGAEFYALVYKTCEEHGYKYGNHYCAHLLDEFSHKTKFGMEAVNFACPENLTPMSTPGAGGQPRFWVLEIHILQDPSIGIYGGFHEDLLNLPLPGEDFSV